MDNKAHKHNPGTPETNYRINNFFESERMISYYKSLQKTGEVEDFEPEIGEKLAVLTHDDYFDAEMQEYCRDQGYKSTFFIMSDSSETPPAQWDIQLHYNKELEASLAEQIEMFKSRFSRTPKYNRNHRLWWRQSHLDLAHLAMNGIRADSSVLGTRPHRLCVEGRLLPIWEVPFSVVDEGHVSVESNSHATRNQAAGMEDLFKAGKTPVVSLFHPHLKEKTKWKEFLKMAERNGYKIVDFSTLVEKHLPRI